MRKIRALSIFLILTLFLTACSKPHSVSYEQFSARLESYYSFSQIDFDYTVEANSNETFMLFSGSAQIGLSGNTVRQILGNVIYAIGNGTSNANSSLKMELNRYWTDNILYTACMGDYYFSESEVKNVLPIYPMFFCSLTDSEKISSVSFSSNKNGDTYFVQFNTDGSDSSDLIFGNLIPTAFGKTAEYYPSSMSATYIMENSLIKQITVSATLLCDGISASDEDCIKVSAVINVTSIGDTISITPPSNLDSYTGDHFDNPLA